MLGSLGVPSCTPATDPGAPWSSDHQGAHPPGPGLLPPWERRLPWQNGELLLRQGDRDSRTSPPLLGRRWRTDFQRSCVQGPASHSARVPIPPQPPAGSQDLTMRVRCSGSRTGRALGSPRRLEGLPVRAPLGCLQPGSGTCSRVPSASAVLAGLVSVGSAPDGVQATGRAPRCPWEVTFRLSMSLHEL